jgi:hypothetical protein
VQLFRAGVVLVAAYVALVAMSARELSAQKTKASPDTVTGSDSTGATADSTKEAKEANDNDEGGAHGRLTAGVSFGRLNYAGGWSERATSATLRYRPFGWLSIGVSPTFAHKEEPTGVASRPTATATGITDIPVEIGVDHAFDAPLSPNLGLGLGITLPVGDSVSGLGAGRAGGSLSLSGGISPVDHLGLHASIGRSLADYSIQSSFNGGAATFADAGLSLEVNDHLSVNLGVDGDVGHIDPQIGRSASLAGGISVATPLIGSISVNASHGISGATPLWSVAIGFGTEFAPLGSTARRAIGSAGNRLRRAFGGGRHGLAAKKKG